jgi:hypothetical protein
MSYIYPITNRIEEIGDQMGAVLRGNVEFSEGRVEINMDFMIEEEAQKTVEQLNNLGSDEHFIRVTCLVSEPFYHVTGMAMLKSSFLVVS